MAEAETEAAAASPGSLGELASQGGHSSKWSGSDQQQRAGKMPLHIWQQSMKDDNARMFRLAGQTEQKNSNDI